MGVAQKRSSVVAQAREWLGRNEADGSHRAIIDLYNARRPPGSYKMTYTDPWCAAFVSAVGMAAGLGDVIYPHVSCDGMIEAYKVAGRWVEDDSYSPAPGDLIFYDWQDSGAGDNTGSADHVGIIVDVQGDTFTVIEGNKSDSVSYRTIRRNGPFIRGFAVPDYRDDVPASVGEGLAPPADSAQFGPDPVGADASGGPQAPSLTDGDKRDVEGAVPYSEALPVLSFGCCGRSVVVAQGILIALGYSCGPDGADGDFGYNTRNAVKRFQRGAGLSETGALGPETWARLLGV